MLKKSTMLVVVLTLAGCSPTAPPEPTVPAEVREKLKNDAIPVAFYMHLREDSAFGLDSITIPKPSRDRIAWALELVWLSESLERDSIFDIYDVTPWAHMDFRTLIPYNQLDTVKYRTLIDSFGLRIQPYLKHFRLERVEPSNMDAISYKMNSIFRDNMDFASVSSNLRGGDGDRIEAWFEADGVRLDFAMRSGDCFVGCMKQRIWSFKIDNAGRVTFLGVEGDPPVHPRYRGV